MRLLRKLFFVVLHLRIQLNWIDKRNFILGLAFLETFPISIKRILWANLLFLLFSSCRKKRKEKQDMLRAIVL